MADPSPKPVSMTLETAISVTKSILVSVGIISTLILFKVAVIPKVATLVITTLPRLWVSFRLWLSPPYIFIVFNFIIFAVAASSIFRRQKDASENNYISHENTHVAASTPYKWTHEDRNFSITGSIEIWDRIPSEDEQGKEVEEQKEEEKPVKWDFPTLFTEKFSDPSSGKSCAYPGEKVEEEEDAGGGGGDSDSMDATWKAIMEREGKQTPQLKKSQTWDSPPPARLIRAAVNSAADEEDPVAWARNEVRKSERFHQTLSFRRKVSLTSEELKSRAEAFIEMVNKSIRLQRQESEQRFLQAMQRSF
ncbi:hypothetical protein SDJN03_20365, partial [Cucurbita argyrosperma subsp. sororia]